MGVSPIELSALGLIGNCQFSALVERTGTIVWCCLPRFDSPPVFGSLLDRDAGQFITGAEDGTPGTQQYVGNTNVLDTIITTRTGRFRIRDFAPRFEQHGRMFRPTMLIRQIDPLDGSPRMVVRCAPTLGWTKAPATVTAGSHHLRFEGFASGLRLTTDLPIAHLDGQPFTLTAPQRLVLTWGDPVEEPLAPMCDTFAAATIAHWQHWVKQCNIPPSFQREVIRSALALKLHCYEDTGAIIAAGTTSIPESAGSGRTWDYRYCWLRDAYYVVDAFRLLGQFDERERFINYLLNIAGAHDDLALAPLYSVSGTLPEDEYIASTWAGFNGDGPVRVGNAAMRHQQHDIFGELVLALAPVFFDERFSAERTPATLDLLLRLGAPPRLRARRTRASGNTARRPCPRRFRVSCAGRPRIARRWWRRVTVPQKRRDFAVPQRRSSRRSSRGHGIRNGNRSSGDMTETILTRRFSRWRRCGSSAPMTPACAARSRASGRT